MAALPLAGVGLMVVCSSSIAAAMMMGGEEETPNPQPRPPQLNPSLFMILSLIRNRLIIQLYPISKPMELE